MHKFKKRKEIMLMFLCEEKNEEELIDNIELDAI